MSESEFRLYVCRSKGTCRSVLLIFCIDEHSMVVIVRVYKRSDPSAYACFTCFYEYKDTLLPSHRWRRPQEGHFVVNKSVRGDSLDFYPSQTGRLEQKKNACLR